MIGLNKWKNTILLLAGIGISNIGAWVYFIALNLIVLDMTHSPFAVSILYILVPAAKLFSNIWSGSFIDRLNKRKLMMVLDSTRALFILLCSFVDSLLLIYVFVFAINMLSSIFESTSIVYMTKLIPEANRQRFNALKNFIQSCGFILGPSIAGLLFIVGTPYVAIQLNAIALCLSVLIIFLLPNVELKEAYESTEKISLKVIIHDWKEIQRFSKSNHYVTFVYILFSGVTICMTALDSVEAAFATQVLHLSESTYGFLVSIAGVGIIVGSLINAVFAKHLQLHFLIGIGSLITPLGYLIFSYSNHFIMASIGFFFLSFALSFANTGFLSFYQNNVPVDIMGRFSSILGILESALIIIFTIVTGLFVEQFGIRPIYIIGSYAFLILGIVINMVVFNKSKVVYYAKEIG